MSSAMRKARAATAILASAGLVAGITVSQAAYAKTSSVTATEGVNIRSGPGTTYPVVGGLYRGQSIAAISSDNGWTKVTFNGSTAYISSQYLTKKKTAAPASPSSKPAEIMISTSGVKVTTARLNVRTGAGLGFDVVTTLAEGSTVAMTGKQKAGFSEISYDGAKRWVSSQYLASSMTGLPKVTGTRIATADLLVRTTSGEDFKVVTEVKKGDKVSVTGATQNGRAQIVYNNAIRWVTAKYLSNQAATNPVAPKLPTVKSKRYATADLLIRTTSTSSYKVITEVPKGSQLSLTGVTKNGRAQVVHNGVLRWVTAQYLSASKPPAVISGGGSGGSPASPGVEKGLQANALKVLAEVRQQFPQIRTIYGVRPDAIPDHPSGRALDLMIPSYESAEGRALGKQIADWAKANRKSLGIEYIIWDQHIWSVARSSEGWRWMADRGGDSANHRNHVHISVYS